MTLYKQEIAALKSTVNELTKQISLSSSKLSDSPHSQEAPRSEPVSQTKHDTMLSSSLHAKSTVTEKNFNVVVYGIDECPPNTAKSARSKNDQDKILPIFSSINSSIQSTSIKDFHRLGKYNPNHNRPRPILVKFLRSMDAQTILSNRQHITSPYVVKPEMSKSEREVESLLLRERWNLLQKGSNRKSIKIHNTRLFINNHPVAEIKDGKLTYLPSHEHTTTNAIPPSTTGSVNDSNVNNSSTRNSNMDQS